MVVFYIRKCLLGKHLTNYSISLKCIGTLKIKNKNRFVKSNFTNFPSKFSIHTAGQFED